MNNNTNTNHISIRKQMVSTPKKKEEDYIPEIPLRIYENKVIYFTWNRIRGFPNTLAFKSLKIASSCNSEYKVAPAWSKYTLPTIPKWAKSNNINNQNKLCPSKCTQLKIKRTELKDWNFSSSIFLGKQSEKKGIILKRLKEKRTV